MSPNRTSRNKVFPWQLTALVILFLPVLILLGFWQLHRAEEKKLLQAKFEIQQKISPLTIQQAHGLKNPHYYPILVEGHFDHAHSFLIDNQFHNHRIGYQVITPFILSNHQPMILINRGWISKKDHQALTKNKKDKIQIKGLLYIPQKNPLISDIFESSRWPQKILTLDLPKISTHLHHAVYPWIILLDPKNPYGFVRQWQPVNMKASMHTGYAFQWFSMALVLIISYVVVRIRWRK